jgi:CBS domain-containing protein
MATYMYVLAVPGAAKIVRMPDRPSFPQECAMRVDTIMSRVIATCAPGDSLDHAARLMWQQDCGCLPVCLDEGRRLAGIITDRDICMSALFSGKPLHALQVETAMAREVQSCRAEETVAEVQRRMSDLRIRRLPVLAADGALAGLVSLADLAREAARQQNSPRHGISCSEVCSTLAAICSPADNRTR